MRLSGKVAVITGAGGGIGLQTAKTFFREGAKVVIADIDRAAAEATAKEIDHSGTKVIPAGTDVTDKDSIDALFEMTVAKFGQVDILINNAGITRDARLIKMTEEQFDQVIATNLKGVFLCGQAAAQTMLQHSGGVILNTASVVGIYGNFGQSNYAAAKAGVIGMTKTWAQELGPKGIRVNAVAPGFILTAMTEKVPEKVLEAMREKCPLKMLGTPEHIADAFLFLASQEAAYINGAILEVTGGLTI